MSDPIKTYPDSAIVYIVDDDDAIRDSLSMLLQSIGIQNSTFDTAMALLAAYNNSDMKNKVGCIVMDIRMPGISGTDCQQELNALGSTLPIIFITGHGDVPMAVEAMKNGAVEFIQKPFRDQQLLDCIQHALHQSAEQQADKQNNDIVVERLNSLTPREKEIMHRVVDGQANKVVATELNLSQRTVEIHRANVMQKMHARSLADLVKMALIAEERAITR